MKIALCLRGLSYGRNTARDPTSVGSVTFDVYHSHHYLNQTLLKKYDVDVFIHTWNHEREDELKRLYQPKVLQIDRITPEIRSLVLTPDLMVNKGGSLSPNDTQYGKYYAKFSNYYSLREVNRLRKEYEEKNQIKYDLVIQCRFDIQLEIKFDLNQLDLSKLYLYLKPGHKFYVGRQYLYDYVFLANGTLMDEFCQLWEKLPQVFDLMKNLPVIKKVQTVYNINNHVLVGTYLYQLCPTLVKQLDFLLPDKLDACVIYQHKSPKELGRISL